MHKIQGTSGAVIYINGDEVFKTSTDPSIARAIIQQGQYMQNTSSVVFPRVKAIGDTGYIMERLYPLEWAPAEQMGSTFGTARTMLEDLVWGDRKTVDGRHAITSAHQLYVQIRAKSWAPTSEASLIKWSNRLMGGRFTKVNKIHGDPTADNMMRDSDSALILTDPIQASGRIPPMLAVDIGKMLQSAYGYERIRYGKDLFDGEAVEITATRGLGEQDVELSRYFCCIHWLRLLPYQHETRVEACRQTLELLLKNWGPR